MGETVDFQSTTLATPPAGTKVAVDRISGEEYQKVKLADGTADSETMAAVTAEGNLQTITPNRTASGTLTAVAQTVEISTNGMGTAVFDITGPFTATVDLQADYGSGTFQGISGWDTASSEAVASITAPATWYVVVKGAQTIRVRCSAYTSGTVTVAASSSTQVLEQFYETSTGWGKTHYDPFVGAAPLGVLVLDKTFDAIDSGNGTSADALRVTVASDSTGQIAVASLPNEGQQTMANSISVAVASNQSAIPVSGNVTVNNAGVGAAVNIQDGGNSLTVDGTVDIGALPNEGQQTMANSISVAVASNQSAIPVSGNVSVNEPVSVDDNGGSLTVDPSPSTTATISSVSDSGTSGTILAANANRKGASVLNTSSAALYLLMGAGTASVTNQSVRLVQWAYFEVPFAFNGQLTGVWASDPNDGAALVTEYT